MAKNLNFVQLNLESLGLSRTGYSDNIERFRSKGKDLETHTETVLMAALGKRSRQSEADRAVQ